MQLRNWMFSRMLNKKKTSLFVYGIMGRAVDGLDCRLLTQLSIWLSSIV